MKNYFEDVNLEQVIKEITMAINSETADDLSSLQDVVEQYKILSDEKKRKYLSNYIELLYLFSSKMLQSESVLVIFDNVLKDIDGLLVKEGLESFVYSDDLDSTLNIYFVILAYYAIVAKNKVLDLVGEETMFDLVMKWFVDKMEKKEETFLQSLNFWGLTKEERKEKVVEFTEEYGENKFRIVNIYLLSWGLEVYEQILSQNTDQELLPRIKEVLECLPEYLKSGVGHILQERAIKLVLELKDNVIEVLTVLSEVDLSNDGVKIGYLNLVEYSKDELKNLPKEKVVKAILKIGKESESDIVRSQANLLLDDLSTTEGYSAVEEDVDNPSELLKEIKEIIASIRSKLIVKSDSIDREFGHYTSYDTVIDFLIKPNLEESFLRLSHLRQLNDPMEGRALFDFLKLEEYSLPNIYKRSNIYISSLSVAKDVLPMWKEYGDDSKGVFLQYDKEYIREIISSDYIEFARVHYIGVDKNSDIDIKLEELQQKIEKFRESQGDFGVLVEDLSRISYLFKVSAYSYEEEYRILVNFDDVLLRDYFRPLNKYLVNELLIGKNEIEKLDEDTVEQTLTELEQYAEKLQKGVLSEEDEENYYNLIKEVRQKSFQVVKDSKYKDFRKYVHTNHVEKGIGLFVYIDLRPLKYSKVMLGPKVRNIDYLAPYLQLIDEHLEVEFSKIPYR